MQFGRAQRLSEPHCPANPPWDGIPKGTRPRGKLRMPRNHTTEGELRAESRGSPSSPRASIGAGSEFYVRQTQKLICNYCKLPRCLTETRHEAFGDPFLSSRWTTRFNVQCFGHRYYRLSVFQQKLPANDALNLMLLQTVRMIISAVCVCVCH